MVKPRTHRLDIYGADIYLATTKGQWRKLARRGIASLDTEAPEAAGLSQFATFHPNDGGLSTPVLVLWVDAAAHKSAGELVDTLAHEASHAAGQLLAHVGHDHRGTDEPHAYLVGWLTRWLWENVGWSEPAST
ncbi:MAG: hypothetical protein HOV78_11325 [Hamadaea sp.]|nr:hypothetical protein [Hamadaea sp.]